jgi:hypothetical protein
MLNFFNHLFRLNDLQLSVSPPNKSSLKQGEDYEEAYPEERYYEEAGEDEWDIEPRAGGYHEVSRGPRCWPLSRRLPRRRRRGLRRPLGAEEVGKGPRDAYFDEYLPFEAPNDLSTSRISGSIVARATARLRLWEEGDEEGCEGCRHLAHPEPDD